jgi:hypothetical protein
MINEAPIVFENKQKEPASMPDEPKEEATTKSNLSLFDAPRLSGTSSLARLDSLSSTSLSALKLSPRSSFGPLSPIPLSSAPLVPIKKETEEVQERDVIVQTFADGIKHSTSSLSLHAESVDSSEVEWSDDEKNTLDALRDIDGSIELFPAPEKLTFLSAFATEFVEPADEDVSDTVEIFPAAEKLTFVSTLESESGKVEEPAQEIKTTAPISLVYSDTEDWVAEDVDSLDLSDLDEDGKPTGFPKAERSDDRSGTWFKSDESMKMPDEGVAAAGVSEAEYLMDDFAGDTDEEKESDEDIIVEDFLDDGEISYGSGSEKSGDDDRF